MPNFSTPQPQSLGLIGHKIAINNLLGKVDWNATVSSQQLIVDLFEFFISTDIYPRTNRHRYKCGEGLLN